MGRSGFNLAFACLLAAAGFWLFAVGSAWEGECPGGSSIDRWDRAISLWPPGADCERHVVVAGAVQTEPYTWVRHPWSKDLIAGLLGVAAVGSVVGFAAGRRSV